ncbi:hypothetical protein [Haliea sp.]|uniref:hypothetical protein n=1 Tax=Haliea sp. TaxID=1932666 RepID=UPI00257EBE26|nr:hypothetical protein [Haliea sp.]|tara:strand:+ start:1098 stop:1319 length:222 start_codon:yes stop_codon:yes gene_type:complete
MKMKNFLKQMLKDTDGNVSSKRVITIISFILMSVGFIVNVFMDIPIKEFIWDGMLYLVAAGLGFSTIEHFSKK